MSDCTLYSLKDFIQTHPKMPSTNDIISDLASILSNFNGREYSGTIDADTLFMQDLGCTSIDVVILGETLDAHYGVEIPFGQFIAELRDSNVQDVQVGALAEFLSRNL